MPTKTSAKRRGNNEGSVYRDGAGWRAEITLGWDEHGRRRTLRFRAKTRKEAADWLAARLAERQRGMLAEPSKQAVADFMRSWLEDWATTSVAPRTFESYSRVVRRYVVPVLGEVPLAKLGPQHLQRLYRPLIEAGHTRTALMVHAVLHRALGHAVKWNLLARNPADLVDPPRHRYGEMRALDPEQARRLLEAARGERLEAVYVLALACGLREGEILGLKWEDLDLKEGVLHVRRTLAWVDGGFRFLEPKTEKSRRTIVLPAVAVAALKRHKARQAEERLALGDWAYPDLVFTTRIGTPLAKSDFIRRDFKRLLAKTDLPSSIRFHDLRHTFATLSLAGGADLKALQAALGHARLTTTADTYAHVLAEQRRRVARVMDEVLGPPRG